MSHLNTLFLYESVSSVAGCVEQRLALFYFTYLFYFIYFILIPFSLQEKERLFSMSIKETTAKVSTRFQFFRILTEADHSLHLNKLSLFWKLVLWCSS